MEKSKSKVKDLKEQYEEGKVTKTEIPNTPFLVITTKEGSFGTLGKYRLTEVYNDKDNCIRDLEKVTWNRIIQVTSLINQILKNENYEN